MFMGSGKAAGGVFLVVVSLLVGALGFAGLMATNSSQGARTCGNMAYTPQPNHTMRQACAEAGMWTLISFGTMFGAFVGVIVGFVLAIFGFIENSERRSNVAPPSVRLDPGAPWKRPPGL